MAIAPHDLVSKLYSKVLTVDNEFISPFRPLEIIKKNCRYYASSFTGRKEGTKALIGVTHKAPIVIDPVQAIYFFPTASPSQHHCMWISFEHVEEFNEIDRDTTEVIFSNKKTLHVSISYKSFQNQLSNTAMLLAKVERRFRQYERERRFLKQQMDLNYRAMERDAVYRSFPDRDLSESDLFMNRLNR